MRRILLAAASLSVLGACGASDEKAAPTPDAPVQTAPVTSPASAPEAQARTPGYNEERNAYFGDMHIHTRNSFDAYIFNVRKTPDDAYRFAKGETVAHPSGFDMTIAGGPLDFYAVTDHAAYLGILPAMDTPGTALSQLPQAKDMFGTDPAKIVVAFQTVGASVRSGEPIAGMYDEETIKTAWQDTVDAADRHNEPGVFTTFSAYEYTRSRSMKWKVNLAAAIYTAMYSFVAKRPSGCRTNFAGTGLYLTDLVCAGVRVRR